MRTSSEEEFACLSPAHKLPKLRSKLLFYKLPKTHPMREFASFMVPISSQVIVVVEQSCQVIDLEISCTVSTEA